MTAYGYCRVSTVMQATDGESLGVQERAIELYSELRGLGKPVIFTESAVSGSIPLADRPQGGKLLATLTQGDAMIAPKLDRAFRSALDALEVAKDLRDKGVALHFIDLGEVTGDGMGKFIFMVLAACAEMERDRLRERVADVKKDQQKRGRYIGGAVPFGYRVDVTGGLVEHAEEQQALSIARDMKARKISLRKIAEHLKTQNFTVSHVTLGRIL